MIDFEENLVADNIDQQIVMHRDAHFSSNFSVMINYYQQEGIGCQKDISLERIQYLDQTEKSLEKDLSGLLLSGVEHERIAAAKQAYQQLKEIYETANGKSSIATTIADMILAEEEEIKATIDAVILLGKEAVAALLDLVRSEDFTDPLFPGYGQAPMLAAECLGKIGDKSAIIALFEVIGKGDFSDEETALSALKAIGEPAKDFLLKIVESRPITNDNEYAAIALARFAEDKKVQEVLKKEQEDPETIKNPLYLQYLQI